MPHWRSREQSIIYWMKSAVKVDQLENARSMSQEAEQPSNYTDYFDVIPYTKGSILH